MDFAVLGPLEVRSDDGARPVVGRRRRALLAALLARAGRTVAAADLVDALWPDDPPPSADHTLHTHVSRLRRTYHLPVTARDGGYALDVAPGTLDAAVFDDLLARAEHASPADAVPLLRAALELWRGPAYGGAADLPTVRAEAQRLEERRRQATERLVRGLAATGHADDAVAAAEALVGESPTRETAWTVLVHALVAAGRPADAADAFQRAAAALDAVGLLPSPDLRAAHAAALAPAPAAAPAAAPGPAAPTSGPATGPPATSPARGADRVPVIASTLVGRAADVAAVDDLLDRARLVTLVGPGGVGKTRLALEVLRRRAARDAGTRVVELTTLTDPRTVPAAAVASLGVRADGGPPEAALRRAGALDLLVLLDNCEHLVEAAADVAEHLLAGGRARVVATSRERLGLAGEHVVQVPPLPTDGAGSAGPAARQLFRDRAAAAGLGAAAADLDPELVDRVVRRLDGLPLAIEMAAARTATLGLAELAHALEAELADGAPLLRHPHRRGPERHRTLRAVIAWSEALLDAEERRALTRWPVFVGPVTADDACAVLEVGRAAVESLVGRSLLVALTDAGTTRYRMLHTVRSAVLADHGDQVGEELRRRHAEHVSAVATSCATALRTADEPGAVARLTGLVAELRSAHAWARRHDRALAVRLSRALHPFAMNTLDEEVLDWAAQLGAAGPDDDPAVGAAADIALAARLTLAGDLTAAAARATRGLARAEDDETRLQSLELLADTALYEGRLAESRAHAEPMAALARATGDAHYLTMAASTLVLALAYDGDAARARTLLADLTAEVGDLARPPAPTDAGWLAYAAGEVAAESDGVPDAALAALDRAAALADVAGNVYLGGVARVSATSLRARAGDPWEALAAFAEVTRWWLARGDVPHLVTTLRNVVPVLVAVGADEAAAELWGAVGDDRLARTYGAERDRLAAAWRVLGARLPADALASRRAAGAARDATAAAHEALAAVAAMRG